MEQITVKDLAEEFALKKTLVISELKKIGVWVPSADTPVDQDIANRIRRRLQLIVDEQEEKAKPEKPKEKKAVAAKPRKAPKKTIKELGTTRKSKKAEEAKPEIPVAAVPASMRPRKGKAAASYRMPVTVDETLPPQRTEVSIEDEPLIEKVEAQLSAEVLESLNIEEPAVVPPEEEIEVPEETAEVGEVAPVEPVSEASTTPTTAPVKTTAAEAIASEAEVRKKAKLAPPPRKLRIVERPAAAPVEEKAPPPAVAKPKPKPVLPKKVAVAKTVAPQPMVEEKKAKKRGEHVAERPEIVTLPETVTVKELSEKLNLKSKDVLRELMNFGILATINHSLDQATAEKICEKFNVMANFVTFEESVIEEEQVEDRAEDRVERAPVVTVMGHVDHGKTSLLDRIRKTNVAGGEAGGITQHIGAYHVDVGKRRIVFLDTPGHEAFTMMRARGAQVTDIVVLVVAADDGVMPQTREAIDHARAAEVPIIVAINKIDKPEANSKRVKQELTEHALVSEEWGGDTVMVEVSATQGTNVEQLLEMILLVAELQDLKANPRRLASGTILEAKLDKGRGAVATVLIQNGTLRTGDTFIAGTCFGKVRAMFDDEAAPVAVAEPSSAVEILGLQGIPLAGDPFQAVEDLTKARQIVDYRVQKEREQERARTSKVSLDDLYARMQAGEVKELPIVLKADVQGSVEVVADTLVKLSTEKVKIKIIHRGVGAISETDVLLASASNAIVVGFNVRPEQNAQALSEKEEVDVRLYTVIYDIAKEVRQAMVGLLEPTMEEAYLGRAEVRQVFRVPKFGTIAGCYVLDGQVNRNAEVRLLRDNVVVYQGKIDSLRRFKEDVTTVKGGYECGISIANYNDLKPGDVIEAFRREEVAPELN